MNACASLRTLVAPLLMVLALLGSPLQPAHAGSAPDVVVRLTVVAGQDIQFTALTGATIANLSSGSNSKAVQNIATNNACFTCQPTKTSNWPN